MSCCQHTVAIKNLLVTFTANDAFLHSSGFLRVLLESHEPRVALCTGCGLELLGVVAFFELKLGFTLLGDLGDLGLETSQQLVSDKGA